MGKCGICWEYITFDDTTFCLICDNEFHSDHLVIWMHYKTKCPICENADINKFYPHLPKINFHLNIENSPIKSITNDTDDYLIPSSINYYIYFNMIQSRSRLWGRESITKVDWLPLLSNLAILYREIKESEFSALHNSVKNVPKFPTRMGVWKCYWKNVDRPPPPCGLLYFNLIPENTP